MIEFNIDKLSTDIIFDKIENEAMNVFCQKGTIDRKENAIIIPLINNNQNYILNNIENIETFSNHSLIKSVSLFYCFDKINKWVLSQNCINKLKFEQCYLNYIHHNLNLIDFSNFKGDQCINQFKLLFLGLTMVKINEPKQVVYKYSDFIFDLLFLLISFKNPDLLENFIKAILISLKTLELNNNKDIKDSLNYIFNINLILFENLLECIITNDYNNHKIWDIIFNSECFFPDLDKEAEIYNVLCESSKINDIVIRHSNIDKIKKLNEGHKIYLKYCKDSLQNINNNNKNKYLNKFKNECSVINYVFISNYLNDIKKYLRSKVK